MNDSAATDEVKKAVVDELKVECMPMLVEFTAAWIQAVICFLLVMVVGY